MTVKNAVKPYPYQAKFNNEIEKEFLNYNSLLGVLPTGGGKTIISSLLIENWIGQGKRVLYLAHKEELVYQPWLTLRDKFGIEASIIKAGHDALYYLPVQIASVPSMEKRPFPYGIDYVIIDEAHHAVADTYVQILEDAKKNNPNVKILGLTATPSRTDGIALGNVFEKMILGPSTIDLEKMGFLCPPKVVVSPINPKLFEKLKISKRTGDYSSRLTSKIMNQPVITHYAIDTWEKHAKGLPTVVFCNSVDHSKTVAAEFQKRGYNIRHVDGGNDKRVRRSIKAKMLNGQLLGISNCMLMTEGVDIPNIQCVLDLQITASIVTHRQKGGRASRLWKDEITGFVKKNYIYLDFVNATLTHGAPNCDYDWSLDGDSMKSKFKKGEINPDEPILKMINEKGVPMAVTKSMLNDLIADGLFLEDYSIVPMEEDEQKRLLVFNRFLNLSIKKGQKRRAAFNAFKEHCLRHLEFPTEFELQYIQHRTGQKSRYSKTWWKYWHEQIQREIRNEKKNRRQNIYQVCIQGNSDKLSFTSNENEFNRTNEICYIYQIPKKSMRDITLKWWKIKADVLKISKNDIEKAQKNIQYNLMKIPNSKMIFASENFEEKINEFLRQKNEQK